MRHRSIVTLLSIHACLAACGGGSGSTPPACTPTTCTSSGHTVGGTVSGLPAGQTVSLRLNATSPQVVGEGAFVLSERLPDGERYEVRVATQPAGAYCVVGRALGAMPEGADVDDVAVRCDSDPATPLFDASRVQRLRLTITADEWDAFVLNSDRSRYLHDAWGNAAWFLKTGMSEVNRRGRLEVLDESGATLAAVDDVGFRMRGTTSRLWPEYWEEIGIDEWQGRPRRFHWNIKFGEDFSDDESVYACIDDKGAPARVWQSPCNGRLADDIPTIEANKDRTFLGLESLILKYNKDDPTYVREALAYAVLNDRGVPAGRAAHATLELVIQGTEGTQQLFGRDLPQSYDMGVFTMLENIDKPYLTRQPGPFGKNGYLFKVGGGDLTEDNSALCIDWDGRGTTTVGNFCSIGIEQSDPKDRAEWLGSANVLALDVVNGLVNGEGGPESSFSPYRPSYDLKTKKKDILVARAALSDLIAKVKDPATTPAQLAAVFDVDGFIRTQAAEIAVGAVDHYVRVANNYYLYLNPDTGKWSYIPYDLDFTFRDTHIASWGDNPPFRNVSTTTVFTGENSWRAVRIDGVDPRLFDLVFSDPANRTKLLQELAVLRRDWLDWDRRTGPVVDAWLDRLEPYIASTQGGDPGSGDTAYSRAAATGDSYRYTSWVNADNSLSTAKGGAFPPDAVSSGIPCDDTIKRFVQRRSEALAAEAP